MTPSYVTLPLPALRDALLVVEELERDLQARLTRHSRSGTDDEIELARDLRDINSFVNRLAIVVEPPPIGGRVPNEPPQPLFLDPSDEPLFHRCAARIQSDPDHLASPDTIAKMHELQRTLFSQSLSRTR